VRQLETMAQRLAPERDLALGLVSAEVGPASVQAVDWVQARARTQAESAQSQEAASVRESAAEASMPVVALA